MAIILLTVLFASGKQTDAASYKRLCPYTGQGSIKIGKNKYVIQNDSDSGYSVYLVKGLIKTRLLSNISNMAVTDGNYIYYVVTSTENGISAGTSVMYRYTISTGKKKKLFKQTLCDNVLEYGAAPCYAYKKYLYYGSQSQYGDKLWSLYVFNTKTCKSRRIKISGLIDGCSVKREGNWIKVSVVDHAFSRVEAKYKFDFSGRKLIKTFSRARNKEE